MKHRNSFLSVLKASEAPMDPGFAAQLREKFAQPSAEAHVSVLSFFIQSMKRNSFSYGAFLSLIALSVYIIIPKGLNPEDILVKAADNYENTDGIYHEKVLHERFENGESTEKAMSEVWSDSKGNFLELIKNPDTDEVLKVNMTVVNEFGDISDYTNDQAVIEATPEISQNQEDWLKSFEGGKIYCYKTISGNYGGQGKSILTLAEDDYSSYTVTGEGEPTYTEDDVNVYDIGKTQDTAASQIKSLIDNKDYSYEELVEDGRKYHTFTQAIAPFDEQEGEGGRIMTYYFDEDTYQMSKQVMNFKYKPTRTDVDAFLISEYLSEENASNIFNPENYTDMVATPMLGVNMMHYSEENIENGCYNYEGQKLSNEETQNILAQVSSEALNEWDDTLEAIKEDMNQEASESDGSQEANLTEDAVYQFNFVKPADGAITQYFRAGHYGLDFNSNHGTSTNVYSAAEGTVIHIEDTDSWNGGYGKSILINHGNGVLTLYAHLSEITVSIDEKVTAGQTIGIMGNTGRASGGAQLHFELSVNEIKVDPLASLEP